MAQERYLSPREILKYICDLEQKLHSKKTFTIYQPIKRVSDVNGLFITNEELNRECQSMLEHVGLGNLTGNAVFCKLDNNTGGTTIPGKYTNGVVNINVSLDMHNNWDAAIATLAHEVCHHVVFACGINPQDMDWLIETYTDLCTIYVGFGNLILSGYRTKKDGISHKLGYLDWNTYKVTNYIVSVVCFGKKSNETGLEYSDILAKYAIDKYESNIDKHKLIKDSFRDLSEKTSAILRNTYFIEQLIGLFRDEVKDIIITLDKQFFREIGDPILPLSTFTCIYETLPELRPEDTKLTNYENAISDTVYCLYQTLNTNRRVILTTSDFNCPNCGRQYKIKDNNGGSRIIKCGQCSTTFLLATDEFNATKLQRDYDSRVKERNYEDIKRFERLVSIRVEKEFERDRKAILDTQSNLKVRENALARKESGVVLRNSNLNAREDLLKKKERELEAREIEAERKVIHAIDDYLSQLPKWLQKMVRAKTKSNKKNLTYENPNDYVT